MAFESQDSLAGEDFGRAIEDMQALLKRGIDEKSPDLLEDARKRYGYAQVKWPKEPLAWAGQIEAIMHACLLKYTEPMDPGKIRLSLVDMARVRSSALKIIAEPVALEELEKCYTFARDTLDAFFLPRGRRKD